MKKIALVVVAVSLTMGVQSFARDAFDAKIDAAFNQMEQQGAFNDLSDTQIDSLQDLVKTQVVDLNLSPDNVDQAFLSGLIKTGLSVLKGLAGKIFGVFEKVGKSIMTKITGLIGNKGTAIVGSLVNKVKGITSDQVKEVAKNVASQAAQDMAASAIADLATSAIHTVTGKKLSEDDKEDAIEEGNKAGAEADAAAEEK